VEAEEGEGGGEGEGEGGDEGGVSRDVEFVLVLELELGLDAASKRRWGGHLGPGKTYRRVGRDPWERVAICGLRVASRMGESNGRVGESQGRVGELPSAVGGRPVRPWLTV
jgi:hypothetical protein